jgi:hypothetical protein
MRLFAWYSNRRTETAQKYIEKCRKQASDHLFDSDERKKTIRMLRRLGKYARGSDGPITEQAFDLLCAIPEMHAHISGAEKIVQTAIETLAESNHVKAADSLFRIVQEVRMCPSDYYATIRTLYGMGDLRAIKLLTNELEGERSYLSSFLLWTCRTLAILHPHGVDALAGVLRDQSSNGVHGAAAIALAEQGYPLGIDIIGKQLDNTRHDEEGLKDLISRVQLLGSLRDGRAVVHLVRLAKEYSTPKAVKRAIMKALKAIGTPEAIAASREVKGKLGPQCVSVKFPYGLPYGSQSPITITFHDGVGGCHDENLRVKWEVELYDTGRCSWTSKCHDGSHGLYSVVTCPKCGEERAFYVKSNQGKCRACDHGGWA